jgi:hypothetical protein
MSDLEARHPRLTKLDAEGEPSGPTIDLDRNRVLHAQAVVGTNAMLLAAALYYPDAVVPDEVVDALGRGESPGLRVEMERAPGGVRFRVHRAIGTTEAGAPVYARPLEEPKPCVPVPCPPVEALAVGLEGVDTREQPFWTSVDLDRCEHGRHSVDPCLSCPGGRSTGNLFVVERFDAHTTEGGGVEVRIGTTVRGEPIWATAHAGGRGSGG